MSGARRVILAEPDSSQAKSMLAGLEGIGSSTECLGTGQEVLFACRKGGVAALVLSGEIEEPDAFTITGQLRAQPDTHGLPILLLLERGDTRGAHRARLVGVDRVLHRPVSDRTLASELRALLDIRASGASATGGLDRLIEALDEGSPTANPLLQHITDPWTGLFNWPYTELKLAEEAKRARRFKMPLTCVLLGIDQVEAFDGEANEAALKQAVNELSGLLLCESRDIDHLARHGLGELCALLFNTPPKGAVVMAERILRSIKEREIELPGGEGTLSASAGIAGLDLEDDQDDADSLIRRAQAALRQSRQWGGNRCTSPDGES